MRNVLTSPQRPSLPHPSRVLKSTLSHLDRDALHVCLSLVVVCISIAAANWFDTRVGDERDFLADARLGVEATLAQRVLAEESRVAAAR